MRKTFIGITVLLMMFGCGKDDNNITNGNNGDGPNTTLNRIVISEGVFERAYAVEEADDGGFVVAGITKTIGAGNSDFYLVKTNSDLEVLWRKSYGTAEEDELWLMIKTSDGGFLLGGSSGDYFAGTRDFYIVKTDSAGNEIWSNTYGGSKDEGRACVLETADGNYVFSGWSTSFTDNDNSDFYLAKINTSGELLWEKTYGYEGSDGPNCVKQTADGGFVIYGEGHWDTSGEWQGIMVKTDSEGNLLWGRTYGTTGHEEGYGLSLAHDDGFVAVGHSNPQTSGPAAYLLKTGSNGEQQWWRTYTISGGFCSVSKTADGGYILYGGSMVLAKTDGSGSLLWSKNYDGESDVGPAGARQTSDGGYIVAGTTGNWNSTQRSIILIKTDENGN